MHRPILPLYIKLLEMHKNLLQTRVGKGVGRLPLFCFDIFKNGIVREVAEKFILIYVLNMKKSCEIFLS